MGQVVKVALAIVLLAGCGSNSKPFEPKKRDAAHTMAIDGPNMPLLPPPVPLPIVPAGLPPLPDSPGMAAPTPETVALGELLFHDPRLSSTGKLACATCHDPKRGYAGAIDATAAGVPNARRTPSLVNLAWATSFGWDGRYANLDELMSVHVTGQLGAPLASALATIGTIPTYEAHFARIGGSPETAMLKSLEAYVLTRYAGGSPWDKLEPTMRLPKPAGGSAATAGTDTSAAAAGESLAAGYVLFTGKARCASCHPPPLYTDHGFHRVVGDPRNDPGRGKVDPSAMGAFATPTLRDATARTMFFHTGAAPTLEAAFDAHVASGATGAAAPGPTVKAPPAASSDRDPLLAGISLTPPERSNLLAFVRALSADPKPAAPPPLPPASATEPAPEN